MSNDVFHVVAWENSDEFMGERQTPEVLPARLRRSGGPARHAFWRGDFGSLHSSERLLQIRNNVLDIFDPDRNADETVGNTDLLALLRRDGSVRHCGGM